MRPSRSLKNILIGLRKGRKNDSYSETPTLVLFFSFLPFDVISFLTPYHFYLSSFFAYSVFFSSSLFFVSSSLFPLLSFTLHHFLCHPLSIPNILYFFCSSVNLSLILSFNFSFSVSFYISFLLAAFSFINLYFFLSFL